MNNTAHNNYLFIGNDEIFNEFYDTIDKTGKTEYRIKNNLSNVKMEYYIDLIKKSTKGCIIILIILSKWTQSFPMGLSNLLGFSKVFGNTVVISMDKVIKIRPSSLVKLDNIVITRSTSSVICEKIYDQFFSKFTSEKKYKEYMNKLDQSNFLTINNKGNMCICTVCEYISEDEILIQI